MLCSYGCGQIGKFKLKNGKLCCEYIFTKCPHIRLKNSLGNIGKEFSKERRSRISKSNKGKKHTEESRKRMSDSKIGKDPWNKGKHGYLSEESKQKLILGLKGKKRTPQQVINIKNALTGKKKSDEHRKNISESRKGKFCGSDNPF